MSTESAYFLGVVATVMRLLGRSNREIEATLHWSPGFLSRLMAGERSLRFDHLVELARALGLTPQELVWMAYPEADVPAVAAVPAAGAGTPTPEERLEEVVERVVARMLGKLAPVAAEGGEPAPALSRRSRPSREPRKARGSGKGRRGPTRS